MHTVLCKHASGTPAEYRKAAASRAVPEICFTDHAPNPDGVGAMYAMEMNQFDDYRKMISEIQDSSKPAVFIGVECDYYPECEKYYSSWVPAQDLDLVLASVHYIGGWGFDNEKEMAGWKSADVSGVWRRYFEIVGNMADSRLFDVIGHFDLPKKFGHRLRDKPLKEMVQPLLDTVAAAGMTIEINTAGLRKPVKEIYPSDLILSLARERGIPICFGSDAHEPDQVGADFDKALKLATDVGYDSYVKFRKRQSLPARLGAGNE